ncbi:hypothetical protein PVAG01_03725 [Phlyctema vagabunda]|uniref:Uncharacterized protein n=1 Tax=Phlyctema vagabunda TaxID=108571 RepID=A0ABR4PM71_9HELO
MFSTLPSLQTSPLHQDHGGYQAMGGYQYEYAPHTSSPLCPSSLSPRSSNATTPPQAFIMSSPIPSYKSQSSSNAQPYTQTQPSQTQPAHPKSSPYSKRVTKTNPLLHNRGDGRETRRKLFLRKVREDSEDKRWRARGGDDEMMRTIWIAEQRRMEERRLRDPDAEVFPDEEEEILNSDQVMADEVARLQDEEIEALLSSLEESNSLRNDTLGDNRMDLIPSNKMEIQSNDNANLQGESSWGSDDEDYDHIFMDVIQQESRQSAAQGQSEDVEMDMC